MERKRFDIRIDDGAMLRHEENRLHFITSGVFDPATDDAGVTGRSTRIAYIPVDNNTVPVIQYNIYSEYDELIHGFSTRMGGVSRDHLASMNLSFSRGDDPENVMENHRRFAAAVGYDHRRLVFSDQIHETIIHVATEADAGRGIGDMPKLSGVDGLVTNVRDLPLITFYADCVPIYFYDPVCHVVGLAHSGWRGTVHDIAGAMIEKMQSVYGCKPENVICAVGPSICRACYEVSSDVAQEFEQAYSTQETEQMLYEKTDGKYLLDLHMACRFNLLHAGVTDGNIAMPDMCTCCNHNVLFSHRASHGMRGNLAAVIMLKGEENRDSYYGIGQIDRIGRIE